MQPLTAVYFHNHFNEQIWDIINNKFQHFPRIMEPELELENVRLVEPSPASEELLLKTHTPDYLQRLKRRWDYRGARLTVGGCADAALRILEGTFRNALCFGVAAGHHAGRSSGWGGTYASVCGGIQAVLEEKYGSAIRIAILDTDSHHGNGTRDVTLGHRNILHVCFCSTDRILDEGTKICVDSGFSTTDEAYLERVKVHFLQRIEQFQPEIVIHLLGHDTARGDYGNRGMSKEFFLNLVKLVKAGAEKICGGRYLINTHGGANLSICEYIHPRIIRILAS